MDYRQKEVSAEKRHEFSRKSLLLGAVFIATFVVAAFVDLDALLRYYHIISGSAGTPMELGATISMISAVPFLAMGMSISADGHRNK
jgi:hypothetical protein